ncbi:hypothetical protein ACHAXR_001697 [Thalassiosira sp. AJA248-18]
MAQRIAERNQRRSRSKKKGIGMDWSGSEDKNVIQIAARKNPEGRFNNTRKYESGAMASRLSRLRLNDIDALATPVKLNFKKMADDTGSARSKHGGCSRMTTPRNYGIKSSAAKTPFPGSRKPVFLSKTGKAMHINAPLKKSKAPRILLSDSESDNDEVAFAEMAQRIAERNRRRSRSKKNRIPLVGLVPNIEFPDVDWSGSEDGNASILTIFTGDILEGKKFNTRNLPPFNQFNEMENCVRTSIVPTHSSEELEKDRKIGGGINDTYSGRENSTISEGKTNYHGAMPQPEQLDDSEYHVYGALKAWRFRYRNEMEVESYNKIIQDRTLCELIRKRRNDVRFASRCVTKNDTIVVQDLLTVWGIGPSKAAQGGVAWKILDVLDSEEIQKHLERSRKKDESHNKESNVTLPSSQNIAEPNLNIPEYVVFKRNSSYGWAD